MIVESNQGFSTFDTLSIVFSIVVVAIIAVPIVSRRVDHQYAEVARRDAESWSQKLTSVENLSEDSRAHGPRDPASLGTPSAQTDDAVGLDPWGRPFHLQYVRNAYGQPIYVVVWSSGPNGKSDTLESKMKLNPKGYLSVRFEDDDIGFVRTVR